MFRFIQKVSFEFTHMSRIDRLWSVLIFLALFGLLSIFLLFLVLEDDLLDHFSLRALFREDGNLRLYVLLFLRYVSNVHNLNRLQCLLRQIILILALQHLQRCDLLQLFLDEVLSNLNSTTHVLEQVNESYALLVHSSVDAY